tara:strand:- start:165 stop:2000 length:1836 start_codon:yes stop_codon:yes gene_type:complete
MNLRVPTFAIPVLLAFSFGTLAEKPDYQHGISLVHDLKYPADFKHFEYSNPSAPKGGTLNVSTTIPNQNFSGAWGLGVQNAAGLERTMDKLLVRSADEQSALYCMLADGIALSKDRKSLFIRLHEKARWHDGVPLTTRDVLFSYDAMMTSTSNVFGKAYMDSWIESVEVVNYRELIIHHREEFTHSNLLGLTTFKVRPAHYYADRGDPFEPTLDVPVGNGPYRVAGYDRNYILYERVQDYWGEDIPVNKGRNNFDVIRYEIFRDSTVAREAFRKGLFDFYIESDVRYWNTSPDVSATETGRVLKDTREIHRWIGQQLALAFNLKRELFQDIKVREALTLVFDFEWQNRVLNHGSQRRAESYFAGSEFAATGLPSSEEIELLAPYRDQLPDRVFTEPFHLPASSGRGINRTALERARQLLSEAGWRMVDGKLRDAEGNPLVVEVATQRAWSRRLLLPYIQSLQLLGIDASVRLLDTVLAVRFKRQRRFDMFLRGLDFSSPPMGSLSNYFGSASAEEELGGNLPGIHNPVVDALIERAQRAPHIETAAIALRALDRVLLWGFYHIPLNMPDIERFMYWDKFGRPNDAIASFEYLNDGQARVIDSWWIDDAKVK